MSDLKPGDEVRVFDVNGRRMGQPEGGWPGTVTKVGRTLIYIDYGNGGPKPFRIESRAANDQWAHQSFRTLEECALRDRHHAAKQVLRAHGLTIEHRSDLTLEQIEAVAALLGPKED